MKTVNFTKTTMVSEGVRSTETATYNVSATIVSDETQTNALQSLRMQVNEKELGYVGDISLQDGRKVVNLINEADLLEHFVIFSEILDEILGSNKEEAVEEELEV